MKIKTLKTYQESAVASGLEVFAWAQSQYNALPSGEVAAEDRRRVTAHAGCLLIEAPTGSGKTLMAAHLLESFSRRDNVVWFWFAPFKGVTGQTVSFLKEQCPGLRLRDLTADRLPSGSRSGDVFVTTWQTVAVKSKDSRGARKESEQLPSTDTLVEELRKMGLRIGVVVDEAHHGFHGRTQAATFYRDVLAPDYTLLITATPDDKDITKWKEQCGISEMQRLTVSRTDAVEAGLVKAGVKCISFIPESASEGLVDMEMTCLRCATGLHYALREHLKEANISLEPLMLVQVDSRAKDSVARAKEKLLKCGWREEQIATHTADEPDAGLLALANDEKRSVLIFKMAVALGFDAPRAFTLVSMRSAKDEDFGVQLLGRILRVHRRLQGKKLLDELNQGYVLLANPDSQSGLEAAGKKMNALKTELARTAPTVAVVCIAGQTQLQIVGSDGQVDLFPTEWKAVAVEGSIEPEQADFWGQGSFLLEGEEIKEAYFQPPPAKLIATMTGRAGRSSTGRFRYELRPDVPRQFKAMVMPEDVENLEEDCARYFAVDAQSIIAGMMSQVQVQKRTLEVFTGQLMLDFEKADLSPAEIARRAQDFLTKGGVMDPKVLRGRLSERLKVILESQGLAHMTEQDHLFHLLNSMLVSRPGLLAEAQKKAVAEYATLEDAEPLPDALEMDAPATQSVRNIYRIYPPGMNTWERAFAESMDAAPKNIVHWWHRNEQQKPWSVNLVRPNGRGFYPDFVISIEGRRKDHGILLADPKFHWEQSEQHGKVLAEHKAYGRALIVYKTGGFGWRPIVWDHRTQKPDLGPEWSWNNAAGW